MENPQVTPLKRNLQNVIFGKSDSIDVMVVALLAGGSVLIEDVPGVGKTTLAKALAQAMQADLPLRNRHPEHLTSLVMTGVTAMARNTAYAIEQRGDPAFPARQIAEVLSAADITHISNEIPFYVGCEARPIRNLLVLCSKPAYMAAIKLVGTDIIGLTGNHMLDYDIEPFLYTLDLYDQEGLPYYGGGRTDVEASRPLTITDH